MPDFASTAYQGEEGGRTEVVDATETHANLLEFCQGLSARLAALEKFIGYPNESTLLRGSSGPALLKALGLTSEQFDNYLSQFPEGYRPLFEQVLVSQEFTAISSQNAFQGKLNALEAMGWASVVARTLGTATQPVRRVEYPTGGASFASNIPALDTTRPTVIQLLLSLTMNLAFLLGSNGSTIDLENFLATGGSPSQVGQGS